MTATSWVPNTSIDAIVFDCDGTLSSIEGITYLAEQAGVKDTVDILTEQAMSTSGIHTALYQQRLSLVQPTCTMLESLAEAYWIHRTPDIEPVIQIFQRLKKTVLVASAGLQQPVTAFAKRLGISAEQVYAVPVTFDPQGQYLDFDAHALMTQAHGKATLAQQLKKTHRHLMHVGDGMNDVEAKPEVTRFVGYGGAFFRPSIAKHCEWYIQTPSMAPLLALGLTLDEVDQLTPTEQRLYKQGLKTLLSGDLTQCL